MRTNYFKPLWQILFTVLLLALVFSVVAIEPQKFLRDLLIDNDENTVGLTVKKPSTQSANAVEIYRGSTLEFAIPGTNVAAGLKSNLGVQSGTVVFTNEFLKTNVFATPFSSAPIVAMGGDSNALPHVVSTTTSNVVIGVGATNKTVRWIAIGAP